MNVDVVSFEQLVAEGSPEALERAVALYRGDLLEGIGVDESSFEEWLRTERERLRELVVEALAKLLGHHARLGAVDPAVQLGVRLLGFDPAQEPVHRTLMRLYVRQGRRGAALRQYEMCVTALARELGLEPEAETRQLYRELLQAPPPVAHPVGQLERAGNVTISETPLVGRAVEAAMVKERLADAWKGQGTIGIIQGEAGIGKTRLIDALVQEASDTGGRVLVGRAYESEQVLLLGPWVSA